MNMRKDIPFDMRIQFEKDGWRLLGKDHALPSDGYRPIGPGVNSGFIPYSIATQFGFVGKSYNMDLYIADNTVVPKNVNFTVKYVIKSITPRDYLFMDYNSKTLLEKQKVKITKSGDWSGVKEQITAYVTYIENECEIDSSGITDTDKIKVVPQTVVENNPQPPEDPSQNQPPEDPSQNQPPEDPSQNQPPEDPSQNQPPEDPSQNQPPEDPSQNQPPEDPSQNQPPEDPSQPQPPVTCTDPNCLSCSQSNPAFCITCKNGYNANSFGLCIKNIDVEKPPLEDRQPITDHNIVISSTGNGYEINADNSQPTGNDKIYVISLTHTQEQSTVKVVNNNNNNLEINLENVDNAKISGEKSTTKYEIKTTGTKTIQLSNANSATLRGNGEVNFEKFDQNQKTVEFDAVYFESGQGNKNNQIKVNPEKDLSVQTNKLESYNNFAFKGPDSIENGKVYIKTVEVHKSASMQLGNVNIADSLKVGLSSNLQLDNNVDLTNANKEVVYDGSFYKIPISGNLKSTPKSIKITSSPQNSLLLAESTNEFVIAEYSPSALNPNKEQNNNEMENWCNSWKNVLSKDSVLKHGLCEYKRNGDYITAAQLKADNKEDSGDDDKKDDPSIDGPSPDPGNNKNDGTSDSGDDKKDGMSGGLIACIVIIIVLAIAIVVILVFFLVIKKRKGDNSMQEGNELEI